MTKSELRAVFQRMVMGRFQPEVATKLPALCDSIGLPPFDESVGGSKRDRVQRRLDLLPVASVPTAATDFLRLYGPSLSKESRYELEESLWLSMPPLGLSKRLRREIAEALEHLPKYLKPASFMELVERLWDKGSPWDAFGVELDETRRRQSFLGKVEQHCIRNPEDWTFEILFEHLGALDSCDRRFAAFVEGLASGDVRPDEAEQRRFVEAINRALSKSSIQLRHTSQNEGYPVFQFVTGATFSSPKNLIFASHQKPDLRLRDALTNDIEIVEGADRVLVYDRPIPSEGLRWAELQAWWAEKNNLSAVDAKKSLYRRLRAALPTSSPPQLLLFETYFETYGDAVPRLPALLPEVWLHWDPKTVEQRGARRLPQFRMDFLLLLPRDARVVIEVDGIQHYADEQGRASREKYAEMSAGDRALRLTGYDVYRFGGSELTGPEAKKRVSAFFERLYAKYVVS